MLNKNIPKDIGRFLFLVLITIIVTYRAPKIIASLWYLFTLVWYYRSKDEPFWLVFYLVTVDGFIGYFGVYTVTIQALPGLPAIELAQFYIVLCFVKAVQKKGRPYIFYKRYITILLFYLVFLIVWGQMMGFSGEFKDYFRVIKLTLPFILFYTLPRLLTNYESYRRLFAFIFIVLIGAFITQLFVLLTGLLPTQVTELTAEQVLEAGSYRGFYNVGITLMGLFGALFYISERNNISFSRAYLYSLIISAYGMAYLSATRGWIISFSFIIIISFVLTSGINAKKISGFAVFAFIAVSIGLSNDRIREQVNYASSRMETLGVVAEGDVTAKGTLSRVDFRGPKVMEIFRGNPVFGWGFSDTARKYADSHVGNQTILLYSGIIGFILVLGFFGYFSFKLFLLYHNRRLRITFKSCLPVFIIFLAGWFIIHSTSGQHFNFWGIPAQVIPQAIFFSFGAFAYSKSKEEIYG